MFPRIYIVHFYLIIIMNFKIVPTLNILSELWLFIANKSEVTKVISKYSCFYSCLLLLSTLKILNKLFPFHHDHERWSWPTVKLLQNNF